MDCGVLLLCETGAYDRQLRKEKEEQQCFSTRMHHKSRLARQPGMDLKREAYGFANTMKTLAHHH